MITEEQRKARINFLGSSDAAAIIGRSRWGTPLSVWAEKTGAIVPEDISSKLQVKLGNRMEAIVADLFQEETGKKVVRVNETIYHPTYNFLAANLDRRVVGEKAILEIKTTSGWNRSEYENDEVPIEHLIQVNHQLMITGWPKAYLCILIGNSDLKIKEIQRDEDVLNDLEKREVSFWQEFVVSGVMPTMITKNDDDTLSALYPLATEGMEIMLGDTGDILVENLTALKQDLRAVEGSMEEVKNQLKALLGTAESGITKNHRISWKNRVTKRIDLDALRETLPSVVKNLTREVTTRIFDCKPIAEKGE